MNLLINTSERLYNNDVNFRVSLSSTILHTLSFSFSSRNMHSLFKIMDRRLFFTETDDSRELNYINNNSFENYILNIITRNNYVYL
jgi:hypothetical protein